MFFILGRMKQKIPVTSCPKLPGAKGKGALGDGHGRRRAFGCGLGVRLL